MQHPAQTAMINTVELCDMAYTNEWLLQRNIYVVFSSSNRFIALFCSAIQFSNWTLQNSTGLYKKLKCNIIADYKHLSSLLHS